MMSSMSACSSHTRAITQRLQLPYLLHMMAVFFLLRIMRYGHSCVEALGSSSSSGKGFPRRRGLELLQEFQTLYLAFQLEDELYIVGAEML